MNSPDDDILGRWNASNQSYAPGHPCAGYTGGVVPALGGQISGPWPGIWLDHAAARMGVQSELFFAEYKKAGGQLDEVVLDTELGWLGFDTWEIADNWANPGTPDGGPTPGNVRCAAAHWAAIQNDKRFSEVLKMMQAHGFDAGNRSAPNWLAHAMAFTKDQTKDLNRRVWQAVQMERAAEYLDTMIVGAAKRHFPAVRVANLGWQMYTEQYCIPDSNSWLFCRTLGLNGAVPGGPANGYSNYVFYGDFDDTGTWAEPGIQEDLAQFFGVYNYTKTEFNMLRLSTHQTRAMVFGGMSTTPAVPVQPWIAWQNYRQPDWGSAISFYNNDYWQEMLVQMAVSGVGSFLYFNPWTFGATMREHQLLQATLLELEQFLGCSDRRWIIDKAIRWQDDFVLGGQIVGPSGARVWRFTAQLPSEFAPVEEPAPPHVGESTCPNVTLPVHLHLSSSTTHGGGPGAVPCTIKFVNATLQASGVSRFGWWIVQPGGLPAVAPPQVRCPTAGLHTTWPLRPTYEHQAVAVFKLKLDDDDGDAAAAAVSILCRARGGHGAAEATLVALAMGDAVILHCY
jgi:hypothetical protein